MGLLLVLGAMVDLVHSRWLRPVPLVIERVNAGGPASADPQTGGIAISLTTTAISVEFPSCDLGAHQPKFFLHLYPDRVTSAQARPFVNRDFDVLNQPLVHVQSARGERCIFSQPFGDVPVRELIFGQFIATDEHCCTILWARDYVVSGQ
jgi:hypothetical protein